MTELEKLKKQIDENYLIPINSLYQYIELEHLDSENEHKISEDEWDNFVSSNEDYFAEQFSLLAQDLFADFVSNREVNNNE
jgi:RecA-family ATPase